MKTLERDLPALGCFRGAVARDRDDNGRSLRVYPKFETQTCAQDRHINSQMKSLREEDNIDLGERWKE